MRPLRWIEGSVAALLLTVSGAQAQLPDLARGRALYENHCQVCHTRKVHMRPNRIVMTRRDMTELVEHWAQQEKLRWGRQEVQDVVEYLARSVYHLN